MSEKLTPNQDKEKKRKVRRAVGFLAAGAVAAGIGAGGVVIMDGGDSKKLPAVEREVAPPTHPEKGKPQATQPNSITSTEAPLPNESRMQEKLPVEAYEAFDIGFNKSLDGMQEKFKNEAHGSPAEIADTWAESFEYALNKGDLIRQQVALEHPTEDEFMGQMFGLADRRRALAERMGLDDYVFEFEMRVQPNAKDIEELEQIGLSAGVIDATHAQELKEFGEDAKSLEATMIVEYGDAGAGAQEMIDQDKPLARGKRLVRVSLVDRDGDGVYGATDMETVEVLTSTPGA